MALVCTLVFNRDLNSKTKLKFTFTPMHGVGQKFAVLGFEAFNLPPFVSVREQVSVQVAELAAQMVLLLLISVVPSWKTVCPHCRATGRPFCC